MEMLEEYALQKLNDFMSQYDNAANDERREIVFAMAANRERLLQENIKTTRRNAFLSYQVGSLKHKIQAIEAILKECSTEIIIPTINDNKKN